MTDHGPGETTMIAEDGRRYYRPVEPNEKVRPYAYFALAILTCTSVLNFLDRAILSILAEAVKVDLSLTDGQMGFLLGTGFAVFYSVVGIAMGRISDGLSRTKLMAFGLTLWSGMTALGAGAFNFATLAAARIGVGVGEATANPCSHALLSDYFPARHRSLVIGTYLVGAFIGGAGALVLGGYMLQHWSSDICGTIPGDFACSLAGWQTTLILVGLPGLPLAIFVARLHEPFRPGKKAEPKRKLLSRELSAAMPPFTMIALSQNSDKRPFRANVALAIGIIALAFFLSWLTGDVAQWAAIGLGAYCVFTWGQAQKMRDLPFFKLTFGCPTFVIAMLGGSLVATTAAAVGAWAPPYAIRTFDMSLATIGVTLGAITVIASGLSVVIAGFITDRWKPVDPRAPIWMAVISQLGMIPTVIAMAMAKTPEMFLLAFAIKSIFTSCWAGAFAAMIQDLVLPRMRGGAASAFALVNVLISLGAGPYWVGKVSEVTGSLSTGLASILALAPIALILLFIAARRLKEETPAGRLARASAAGEPNPIGD